MNPASNPSISIPRSRFMQEFNHTGSFLHGKLIPIDCFEVIPGDDYTVKKAAKEIIMSTPIAPILGGNIKLKVCAFFVPTRLLWEHTEEFYGANKTSSGPQTTTYKIPNRSIFRQGVSVGSVSHYLGKPLTSNDSSKYNFGWASVLKERGYYFIWSEWYRAQQLQNPVILNRQDGGPGDAGIGSLNGNQLLYNSDPLNVCKQYDIFTAATMSPQYGSAVELPLGTYAPVVAQVGTGGIASGHNVIIPSFAVDAGGQNAGDILDNGSFGYSQNVSSNALSPLNSEVSLFTDLSHALAAKINDIRYAFQLQKYLERSNFGSRFFEVLAVHYGVTSPDGRLQRPEYLGGKSAPIIIRTVLSQAGYSASTGQQVGQPGASSITYVDLSGLFSKGFVEPGYVFILASTTHERSYTQGLLREDTKFDRFEFYSPEFNNLGDQEIKNKEIMVTGDASDDLPFGYQGHWDEYRYRLKRCSGILDPSAPNSLSFWTLAEKFNSRPSLSASFIEEDRSCLSRALVTGATGPDYLFDLYIQYQATREMSMYAIPGLIDHFGAL